MPNEWLTTAEACELLALSRTRLVELRRANVFRVGVHYTKPEGMKLRWRRSALEAHLSGERPRRSRSKLAQHLMP